MWHGIFDFFNIKKSIETTKFKSRLWIRMLFLSLFVIVSVLRLKSIYSLLFLLCYFIEVEVESDIISGNFTGWKRERLKKKGIEEFADKKIREFKEKENGR